MVKYFCDLCEKEVKDDDDLTRIVLEKPKGKRISSETSFLPFFCIEKSFDKKICVDCNKKILKILKKL